MIIFTDVDGTLYDYDLKLPQSAVKAIKKLRENGHRVYMVTGRSKAENKKEVWDIGFDGMIGGNGSYVEDDGEVLMHQRISYDQCKRIVDWCHERNIDFYEEANEGLFASEHFVENAKEPLKLYSLGKGKTKEEVEKLEVKNTIHGIIEGEELYRDDLNKVSFILHSYQDYLDAVKDFPDLKVGTWGGRDEEALFGDFGVKDIDKAKAIEVLLKHLNEDVKNTIAIGDADVDIPMLQYCGIGIAMGSGGQHIKEVADLVTDNVDKDGFYKAFKELKLI
ncbi:MAG: Cof-type HAD-IIB family hydrolase [Erysipelotrichaceae bacterium]|nr:Cof-type HAD-IIB family hydrolase [Erysipelotrichaceae bacterium]